MVKVYRVVIFGMKNVGKTSILQQAIYRNYKEQSKMFPTVEDIHLALVETEKGSREQIRFYDTCGVDPTLSPMLPTGDQCNMMRACNQLARQYATIVDGFILVYDTSRSDSLDCIITLKKEIDKTREKKEGVYVIVGHRMNRTVTRDFVLRESASYRASQWAIKERVHHFEVNALDRTTIYEPFIHIASKVSTSQSRSSFSQLSMVRKNIRND